MKFSFTLSWQKFFTQTLPVVAVLFCVSWMPPSASAQNTCTYTIEMFDSFGDGWNGGTLTVTSNGVVTTHTLATGSFGTSSFTVTHGTPIVLFYTQGIFTFEPSYNVLDPDGIIVFSSGQPAQPGEVFSGTGNCPSCPAPNSNLVFINQVTDSSAHVNWANVPLAESYLVEYGPAGYPFGVGLTIDTTASAADLFGLNPCVSYDVYIASVCGVDSVSTFIGPYTFQTTYTPADPGDTCTYTLEFFDSFGDGWNGSFLTVTTNGISTQYTLPFGSAITYTFTAISNLPIEFSYTPGAFQNEVTYNIIDPNGVTIFSDGPFPAIGNVFITIACPTCPGPLSAFMSDVNATNAKVTWQPSPGASGQYIIEYGPLGFTFGEGTLDTVEITKSSATLTGLLENTWYDVYVKLDCGTEFSKHVGPIIFHTLWLNDIGVSFISEPDPFVLCDLSEDETITISLTNYGQVPQTLFNFYFAVNGVPANIPVPQDGLFTGVVGNDSTETISFETTWDFSEPGLYIIEAWTDLDGDSDHSNDTFRLEILTALPKPLKEDFEDNAVPFSWAHSGFIYPPNSHNNPTYVIASNLFAGNTLFTLTTGRIGPIEAGDSLTFDYRYVNWFAGTIATTLGGNDKLDVQISTDCGMTFQTVFTINSANHVSSVDMANKAVDLSQFAGEAITIRFLGTWSSGDYWLDIDNINILGCPATLGLLANVHPSLETEPTGSIDVNPYFGETPFTYLWNTGDTTEVITDLPPGVYEVTVTDANGCSDSQSYDVSIGTDANEVVITPDISLYPNPAGSTAFLNVRLPQVTGLQLRLMNMNGQVLFETDRSNETDVLQELDLSQQPPGMYLVQIVADGKPYYAKLMVAR